MAPQELALTPQPIGPTASPFGLLSREPMAPVDPRTEPTGPTPSGRLSGDLARRVEELGALATDVFQATDRAALVALAARRIGICCPLDELVIGVLDDGDWHHRSAVRTAAETGELIYEPDTAVSPYPDVADLAARGLVSAVVVPMRAMDRPVGALLAARATIGFTGPDLMTLDQAASVVGAALELCRTSEIAQRAEVERSKAALVADRRADELAALHVVANAFDRLDAGHAAAVTAGELAALRGIEVCRVCVVAPRGELVPVASAASHGSPIPPLDTGSPDALALATGDLVLWRRPDESDLLAIEGLARTRLTSAFAVPVVADDQVVGTIMAGSTGGHRLVTDEHLLLADLAGQLLVEAAGGVDGLHALAARYL